MLLQHRGIDAGRVEPEQRGRDPTHATAGLRAQRTAGLSSRSSSRARVWGPPTFSVNVTPCPSTSSTGTGVAISMCTLNTAGVYAPMPELAATRNRPQAASQDAVRATGHRTPVRCSRRTAHRYSAAARTAAEPNRMSQRQRTARSVAVRWDGSS